METGLTDSSMENTKIDNFICSDPFILRKGSFIKYKGINYFFRPNGSVAFLFKTLEDYKKKSISKKVIARSKLKGCNYSFDTELDLASVASEEYPELDFETEWNNRRTVLYYDNMTPLPM